MECAIIDDNDRPPEVARLQVNETEYVIVQGVNLIGSDSKLATILVIDSSISNTHAQIIVIEDWHFIVDLRSVSGTSMNEVLLTPFRCYPIPNSAAFKFGNVTAEYHRPSGMAHVARNFPINVGYSTQVAGGVYPGMPPNTTFSTPFPQPSGVSFGPFSFFGGPNLVPQTVFPMPRTENSVVNDDSNSNNSKRSTSIQASEIESSLASKSLHAEETEDENSLDIIPNSQLPVDTDSNPPPKGNQNEIPETQMNNFDINSDNIIIDESITDISCSSTSECDISDTQMASINVFSTSAEVSLPSISLPLKSSTMKVDSIPNCPEKKKLWIHSAETQLGDDDISHVNIYNVATQLDTFDCTDNTTKLPDNMTNSSREVSKNLYNQSNLNNNQIEVLEIPDKHKLKCDTAKDMLECGTQWDDFELSTSITPNNEERSIIQSNLDEDKNKKKMDTKAKEDTAIQTTVTVSPTSEIDDADDDLPETQFDMSDIINFQSIAPELSKKLGSDICLISSDDSDGEGDAISKSPADVKSYTRVTKIEDTSAIILLSDSESNDGEKANAKDGMFCKTQGDSLDRKISKKPTGRSRSVYSVSDTEEIEETDTYRELATKLSERQLTGVKIEKIALESNDGIHKSLDVETPLPKLTRRNDYCVHSTPIAGSMARSLPFISKFEVKNDTSTQITNMKMDAVDSIRPNVVSNNNLSCSDTKQSLDDTFYEMETQINEIENEYHSPTSKSTDTSKPSNQIETLAENPVCSLDIHQMDTQNLLEINNTSYQTEKTPREMSTGNEAIVPSANSRNVSRCSTTKSLVDDDLYEMETEKFEKTTIQCDYSKPTLVEEGDSLERRHFNDDPKLLSDNENIHEIVTQQIVDNVIPSVSVEDTDSSVLNRGKGSNIDLKEVSQDDNIFNLTTQQLVEDQPSNTESEISFSIAPTQDLGYVNDKHEKYSVQNRNVTNKNKTGTENVIDSDDIHELATQKIPVNVDKGNSSCILQIREEFLSIPGDMYDVATQKTDVSEQQSTKNKNEGNENNYVNDLANYSTQDDDIFEVPTQKIPMKVSNGSSFCTLEIREEFLSIPDNTYDKVTQKMDVPEQKSIKTKNKNNCVNDLTNNTTQDDDIFDLATQKIIVTPNKNDLNFTEISHDDDDLYELPTQKIMITPNTSRHSMRNTAFDDLKLMEKPLSDEDDDVYDMPTQKIFNTENTPGENCTGYKNKGVNSNVMKSIKHNSSHSSTESTSSNINSPKRVTRGEVTTLARSSFVQVPLEKNEDSFVSPRQPRRRRTSKDSLKPKIIMKRQLSVAKNTEQIQNACTDTSDHSNTKKICMKAENLTENIDSCSSKRQEIHAPPSHRADEKKLSKMTCTITNYNQQLELSTESSSLDNSTNISPVLKSQRSCSSRKVNNDNIHEMQTEKPVKNSTDSKANEDNAKIEKKKLLKSQARNKRLDISKEESPKVAEVSQLKSRQSSKENTALKKPKRGVASSSNTNNERVFNNPDRLLRIDVDEEDIDIVASIVKKSGYDRLSVKNAGSFQRITILNNSTIYNYSKNGNSPTNGPDSSNSSSTADSVSESLPTRRRNSSTTRKETPKKTAKNQRKTTPTNKSTDKKVEINLNEINQIQSTRLTRNKILSSTTLDKKENINRTESKPMNDVNKVELKPRGRKRKMPVEEEVVQEQPVAGPSKCELKNVSSEGSFESSKEMKTRSRQPRKTSESNLGNDKKVQRRRTANVKLNETNKASNKIIYSQKQTRSVSREVTVQDNSNGASNAIQVKTTPTRGKQSNRKSGNENNNVTTVVDKLHKSPKEELINNGSLKTSSSLKRKTRKTIPEDSPPIKRSKIIEKKAKPQATIKVALVNEKNDPIFENNRIPEGQIETGKRKSRATTSRQISTKVEPDENKTVGSVVSEKQRDLNEKNSLNLRPKYNIMFTLLNNVKHKEIIRKLAGKIVDELVDCDVLVTETVKRTIKLLGAISLGKPIVSPNWLVESAKQKQFLNPWDYLLIDEDAQKRFKFDLRKSLEVANRRGLLFQNYQIFVTKSVDAGVNQMLQTAGATCLSKYPDSEPSDKCFIVTTAADLGALKKNKMRKKPLTVSTEAVFISLIQQTINLQAYILK